MAKDMEEELISIVKENAMKANGNMIWEMDKEYCGVPITLTIKAHLKTIKSMDQARSLPQRELNTLKIGVMVFWFLIRKLMIKLFLRRLD